MARIRTIKPEFWEDEKIAGLPIPCRLFFIGIWNFADDFGVVRGNPSILKAKIFPYDDLKVSEIEGWIKDLVHYRMIVPITHNNESYYVIRTFQSHQMIDKRYQKCILPKDIMNEAFKRFTSCTHSDHMGTTPQEKEKEMEVEKEMEMEVECGDTGEETSPANPNDIKKDILKKRYFNFVDEVKELYPSPTEFEMEHIFGSKKIKKCFLSYWGEPNKSLTKMRFELEKTWNTKMRILAWLSNAEKWDLGRTNNPGDYKYPSINKKIHGP
jgi:hypothetical protein